MKKLHVLILALCLLLSFGSIPAMCADIDDEEESDEFILEEITVTAQKREENQQKVAIAMDVISAEEITELGKNDIDDILTNVSSAIVQKAADGLRVFANGGELDAKKTILDTEPMFTTLQILDDGTIWVRTCYAERDLPDGVFLALQQLVSNPQSVQDFQLLLSGIPAETQETIEETPAEEAVKPELPEVKPAAEPDLGTF